MNQAVTPKRRIYVAYLATPGGADAVAVGVRIAQSLDAAIDELGADYTEEEIRLVRIKFICEQGN